MTSRTRRGAAARARAPLTLRTLSAPCVAFAALALAPLYLLRLIFAGTPALSLTPDHVLGVLSLLIWTLIAVVSLKWIGLAPRAAVHGEGGVMALLVQVLRRGRARIAHKPRLALPGIFAAALFCAESATTPAIALLAASEGVTALNADWSAAVPWLAALTALLVFHLRRRGLVSTVLAPLAAFWLLLLAGLGAHAVLAAPQVLLAFNPWLGIAFLLAEPAPSLTLIASVVLVAAGSQHLFSRLECGGVRALRLGWLAGALPALLLAYCGQGALLLGDAQALAAPFFRLLPLWGVLPLTLLALAVASVVALAALEEVLALLRQSMQLGLLPRFDLPPAGQAASDPPALHWGLLLAVLTLIFAFRSTAALAPVYALAVAGGLFLTSLLLANVALRHWHWDLSRQMLVFLLFLPAEALLLVAALPGMLDGGWLVLAVALALTVVMATWRRGRQVLKERQARERLELLPFIDSLAQAMPTRVSGTAIFLDSDEGAVPHALLHNLMHNKVLHERVVIVSVRFFDQPEVPDIDRVEVHGHKANFWTVTLHYGFRDEPDIPLALSRCAESGLELSAMDSSYFLGREALIPAGGEAMALWRKRLFAALYRNAGSPTAFFRIPSNRVVELGAQVSL